MKHARFAQLSCLMYIYIMYGIDDICTTLCTSCAVGRCIGVFARFSKTGERTFTHCQGHSARCEFFFSFLVMGETIENVIQDHNKVLALQMSS